MPPSWAACCGSVMMDPAGMLWASRPQLENGAARSPRSPATASLLGEEPGFLHEAVVHLLGVLHPLQVFRAGHEGLVERAVLHELLPVGRLAHLLEHVDEIGDL